MKPLDHDYLDDDQDCRRTYATLRIYTGELDPNELTELLDVTPSRIWQKPERPLNAWYLTSKGAISANDSRRHIDYLLATIKDHQAQLEQWRTQGLSLDMICFWHSNGQGGPRLSPAQSSILAALDMTIAWNIYQGD